MSHHYSGPALGFPHGERAPRPHRPLTRSAKPGDDRKSILIMNVHPSFSLEPRGAHPGQTRFAHEAIYEFKIDTDGDFRRGHRLPGAVFPPFEGGGAKRRRCAYVRGAGGPARGRRHGRRAHRSGAGLVGSDAARNRGRRAPPLRRLAERPLLLRCAWRPWTASSSPTKTSSPIKDVCSIVLEIPNVSLAPGRVGIWARTLDGAGGRWGAGRPRRRRPAAKPPS